MILWTLAAALSAWLVYLILAAWALRSDTIRKAINRHPDRFFITWRSASSWFPGSFRVQGLHFIGQGTASQYFGRMDDASFRVRLLPLFRKTLSVGTFDGRGIEFQLRRTSSPADTNAPPIPGLDSLPRRTAPRSGRGRPSWWIHVDEVALRQIERVWIYGSRLEGPATLSATLDMQIEGPFHVRAHRLDFPEATFIHNGVNLARHLALNFAGELGPLTFGVDDVPDNRILEFISGHLRVGADLGSVSPLRDRLGTHEGIQFTGEGRMDGEVRLARGVLQEGTRLAIHSPHLQLSFGGTSFTGSATVEDQVLTEGPQPVAQLAVQLRDLVISRDGRRIGYAEGPLLNLKSTSRNLSVTNGFKDTDLALRIEPLILPDASWLTEFIPVSSGIALTGGAIRLDADLRASARGPIHGNLTLAGDAVSTTVHGEAYEASLHLAVQLAQGTGGPRVLHLENTSLRITNLFVPNVSRDTQEGWHAVLGVPAGRLDLTEKNWSLDSSFHIGLRDTRPILAVLRNQPDAPGWLRLMPTLRDLEGEGRISTTRDQTRLSEVNLRGKSTDFRAELLLAPHQLSGIAYARYGLLAAGMDRRDPQKPRWRIIGAKRWFERALASPHTPPSSGEPEEPEEPDAPPENHP
jgi:hypothetical protein